MGEGGLVVAEEPVEVDLSCTGAEQVTSSYHLIDAHEGVVYDDGELVGKDPIAAPHEEVSALTCKDLALWTVYDIAEGDRAVRVVCVWYFEPCGCGTDEAASSHLVFGERAAGTCVDVGAVRGMGSRGGMEFGARAEAGIGEAMLAETPHCLLVDLVPVTLVEGTLVPVKPKPPEVIKQEFVGVGVAASWVEVLDAENELSIT